VRKRLLLFMAAVIMLSGCAASDSASAGMKNQNGAPGNSMQQGMAGRSQPITDVSDEIKNNATKILTGTVQSIVGNEATLLVTKESSGTDNNTATVAEKKNDWKKNDKIYLNAVEGSVPQVTDGENAKFDGLTAPTDGKFAEWFKAAEAQSDLGKRQSVPGHDGGSKKTKDASSVSDKGQNTDSEAEKVETLLLPVGMKIGTKDYTTVTAGSTITVYFGLHPDDGSEIITAVELSGGRR